LYGKLSQNNVKQAKKSEILILVDKKTHPAKEKDAWKEMASRFLNSKKS
jgi:hypothetical protein